MAGMKIVNRAGGRVDEEGKRTNGDKSLAGHLLTNKTLTKPTLELSILNLQIGTFTRASTRYMVHLIHSLDLSALFQLDLFKTSSFTLLRTQFVNG